MMRTCLCLVAIACFMLLALPVQAQSDDGQTQRVIYQTAFSSDPRWTTNSPSSDYWDPSKGMYHFSIEPSTGNYAYIPVENIAGPFTFEYDVILEHVDDTAAFRMGLTGGEMDFNKGPNVFNMFTNAKYGQIMWLHTVTVGGKLIEVNSESDDEILTVGSTPYRGPTVNYELNRTYHVTTMWDEGLQTLTMRVTDKLTGKLVWSYFIRLTESIHGMNHIYMGSRGDYGNQFVYARGYIDNVRLTVPGPAVTTTEQTFAPPVETTAPPATTMKRPVTLPTPLPTETPQSSPGAFTPVLALCVLGTVLFLSARLRR